MYWNCVEDKTGPKKRSELLAYWQEELENIIFLQGRSSVVLKMLGIDVDSLIEEMDSIVENRVEFLDMVEQYVAIMTDRKLIDSQSKKSKKSKSETKNRWA